MGLPIAYSDTRFGTDIALRNVLKAESFELIILLLENCLYHLIKKLKVIKVRIS